MASSDQPSQADARSELSDPDHDVLYQEIGLVRTKGLWNLADTASDLPALLSVAHVIGSGTSGADKIEEALRQTVQRLGGKGTSAIEALLGMTSETRGQDVKTRRERAAALYDYKAYEVFRTRFEPSLLMFVATYLRILVAEHRLAERERLIAARDGALNVYDDPAFTDAPGGLGLARNCNSAESNNRALPVAVILHHKIYAVEPNQEDPSLATVFIRRPRIGVISGVGTKSIDDHSDSWITSLIKGRNTSYIIMVDSKHPGDERHFYRPPNRIIRQYRRARIRVGAILEIRYRSLLVFWSPTYRDWLRWRQYHQ